MLNGLNSFWNGDGERWKGYKATTFAVTAGIVNTLVENSWVFTNLPLSGESDSDPAAKTFYLLSQMLAVGVLSAVGGLTLDYLRSNFDNTERAALIPK